MLVGLKDINGVELKDGQKIRIYDKEDGNRIDVDGYLEYLPAAFMIHPFNGSHDLLLYWYVRTDGENSTIKRYAIEVYE